MISDRQKAKAKNDFHVLMAGNRFSNFIKNHIYDIMERDDCIYLIDEDICGNQFSKEEFEKNFEIVG